MLRLPKIALIVSSIFSFKLDERNGFQSGIMFHFGKKHQRIKNKCVFPKRIPNKSSQPSDIDINAVDMPD